MSVGVLRVNYFALVPASMIEPIAFSLKTTVSGPFASKHTDIELGNFVMQKFPLGTEATPCFVYILHGASISIGTLNQSELQNQITIKVIGHRN